MYYQLVKTANKCIGVVWDNEDEKIKLKKIYLPKAKNELLRRIRKDFSFAAVKEGRLREGLDRVIAAMYQGKVQKMPMFLLDMEKLAPFTKKVLIQARKIPRGHVATYSSLAKKIGNPKAARAVGTAMARNPFPIVVPCHRVIRADGTLGGFGGGLKMKKMMLQREGIKI
ncbi:MAG TPA: MGMT family protein [Smithellaceae bacterium]|nr:MGMT family protein [Smithellaceae bacterium]HRS89917.1 MGMT family protein [Smithellaceae bacterium]HRV26684.1 MGMT family protein [Smithellaceae bacterium]